MNKGNNLISSLFVGVRRTCKLCRYKIYLCFLLLLFNNFCNGYKNVRLQDFLCADKLLIQLQKPFRGDLEMTLEHNQLSAAIITQKWNTTLPGFYTSNKIVYDCRFRVKTPDKSPKGIYTVITLLKFRRNPETKSCIDFIQFSSGNRSPSERICNDISIDGPAGRLIFDERHRDVNVHIHVDKRYMIDEPLELRMVLTAHTECQYTGDFLCDPNDAHSCISRYFVRDNVTNCMYPCRDEVSCFHDAVSVIEMDTTNVALSAITSLILTMLGMGFCVWICWKYWNCITAQQEAREASSASTATVQRHISREAPIIDLPTSPSYETVIAAANMSVDLPLEQEQEQQQQENQRQSQSPKDLPPSYESLFPER